MERIQGSIHSRNAASFSSLQRRFAKTASFSTERLVQPFAILFSIPSPWWGHPVPDPNLYAVSATVNLDELGVRAVARHRLGNAC